MENNENKTTENDEDTPCDVCRGTESEPFNEMVFCDVCDVCVHQSCYGIHEVPPEAWLCKPCQENIRPKCIFCPSKKGAMKKTRDGNWAHISCALWISEVSFGDPDALEDIFEKVPKSRWNLRCSLCRIRPGKKSSACIQCYVDRCRTAYHVTCAFDHKLYMKMEEDPESEEAKFESFCSEHSKMKAAGLDPKGDISPKKRKKVPESPSLGDLKNEDDKKFTSNSPLQSNGTPTANNNAIPDISNKDEKDPKIKNKPVNRANESFPELFTGQNTAGATGLNNPCVSFTEPAIIENVNRPKVVKKSTEPAIIENISRPKVVKISVPGQSLLLPLKATARKSFPLPPKKRSLTEILPKPIVKPNINTINGASNPKKPRKSAPTKNPSQSPKKPRQKASPQPPKRSNISIHTLAKTGQASLFASPNQPLTSASYNQASSSASYNQASSSASHNLASTSASYNSVGIQSPQVPGAMPQNHLDDFLRYLGSLIRPLSVKRAMKIQKKIMTLVYKEHQLSSDESDVSSISSID